MSNRLALFDCDGTLIDSQHVIVEAMADCFGKANLPLPAHNSVRRVVGLSLVEAISLLHPAGDYGEWEQMAESYKRSFRAMRNRGVLHEPLYEGIADCIAGLDAAGWMLGVATGKSTRGLKSCLDTHDLGAKFVTLQTADNHPSKPHPSMALQAMAEAGSEPAHSIMIGDTSFDMAMAKAAGMHAIGVAWGYHDPHELQAAGADVIIEECNDLLPYLLEKLP